MHNSFDLKSLTILHVRWNAQAWSKVKADVIKNVLERQVSHIKTFQVVRRMSPTEDPFLDLDNDEEVLEDEEVQVLSSQLQVENPCTANKLALADDDMTDLNDERWEENFLAKICPSSSISSH